MAVRVRTLRALLRNFKHVQFVILSHSNVGFLQADPHGVELLRKYHELAEHHHNLRVGGNSERFVKWLSSAYGKDAILLPNLYPVHGAPHKPAWDGKGTLKVGAFGAVRPEKNFMTAAAAAVLLHRKLRVPVELHMSSGGEGDQGRTAPAIDQMADGLGGVTVVRHNWMYWDDFIKLVGSMDLLIQVSYTESFNMVTADGISQGVPSVVSSAIYWAPAEWKAEADDASDVARVGLRLLTDSRARSLGLKALVRHNRKGLHHWLEFLFGVPRTTWGKLRRHLRKLGIDI